jgi:protoporphyrinogen oxidase
MRKKVSIIGAGIAGLSAGCYLQMNGYDTQIFEMHDKPGGGLPTAIMSGRNVSQIICKEDKKVPFKTSLAQRISGEDHSATFHL